MMMPVNVWLFVIPPGIALSRLRKLMRDWGLLEWGSCPDRICHRLPLCLGAGVTVVLIVIKAAGRRFSQYFD